MVGCAVRVATESRIVCGRLHDLSFPLCAQYSCDKKTSMMRRELFLCYLTFLLTAGCKQVTLGDDGFTGTWSDMGAGMQQPNGGRGGNNHRQRR